MVRNIILLFLGTIGFVNAQEVVTISKEDAKEDLEFMVKSIKSAHYSPFEDINEEDFLAKKDSIISSWEGDVIPLRLFISGSMKLAAMVSGGNTSVEWQNAKLFPELGVYGFLPFKMNYKDGELVTTYSLTDEVKKGDGIKSINGKDALTLFEDIKTYSGGVDALVNEFAENFLPLYLFINAIKPPYLIEKSDGEIGYIPNGLSLIDGSQLLTSHLPKELFNLAFQRNDIALLTINTCSDVDTFKVYIDSAFQVISEKGVTNLIVDIRKNNSNLPELNDILLPYLTKKKYRQTSGRYWKVSPEMKERITDSVYVAAFGQKFADKFTKAADQSTIKDLNKKKIKPQTNDYLFTGVTCFLIGPGTSGSATDLADAIKTYEISSLLGQPTGELTNAYGEYIRLTMPNSGTYFFLPTTYDLGADGDLERKSPVMPDVEVEKHEIDFARNWLMNH